MIAVFVRHDDGARTAKSFLNFLVRGRIVGLFGAAAEKFVDLLVHAGVDHDVSVRIDDLKRGAGLDAGVRGRTFDREILGPAAFGELDDIDVKRVRTWEHARNGAQAV